MANFDIIFNRITTTIITVATVIGTYVVVVDHMAKKGVASSVTPVVVPAATDWWAYALIAIGTAAFVSQWIRWWIKRNDTKRLQDRQFANWPDPYNPIAVVHKNFRNERVPIDGYSYSHCDFQNVTFVYNGTTQVQMNHCTGTLPYLHSDNPQVLGGWLLAYGLGLMRENLKIGGVDGIVEPAQWRFGDAEDKGRAQENDKP